MQTQLLFPRDLNFPTTFKGGFAVLSQNDRDYLSLLPGLFYYTITKL